MSFIKIHYNNIVQPDLLLTSVSSSPFTLAHPVKIVISLKRISPSEADILYSAIALQLVANQKSYFLRQFYGGPIIGSSLTLRHDAMYNFLARLLFEVLPRLKQFEGLKYPSHSCVYSFVLNDLIFFDGISKISNYSTFSIKRLQCDFHSNTNNSLELVTLGRFLSICFQELPRR